MSQMIATEQLVFDDFKKDNYRAFKLKGQPIFISLPTIRDQLLDMLVAVERQMEQGDHLAITLSVSRPSLDTDQYNYGQLLSNTRKSYFP